MKERPKEPGQYLFKGYLDGGEYAEGWDFDWSPVEVFFNEATQRLNGRIKDRRGTFADRLGRFCGEWRLAPSL